MNKKFWILAVLVMLVTTAVAKDRPAIKTCNIKRTLPSSVEHLADSKLDVDYPTAGSPLLVQAVREYILAQFGMNSADAKRLDLNDIDAVTAFLVSTIDTEEQSSEDAYKLAYENSQILTYSERCYSFPLGAAHGFGSSSGITFRKADGMKFTWDMIDTDRLQPFIKRGLTEFFDVSTDAELEGCLFLASEYSVSNLPIPAFAPWIVGDEIHFAYSPYEIAGYAHGQPTFSVPITQIAPLLNAVGKTFIEP